MPEDAHPRLQDLKIENFSSKNHTMEDYPAVAPGPPRKIQGR